MRRYEKVPPCIVRPPPLPCRGISLAVWLYFRFPLSLPMVEEMLAARGILVSHETVRRWAEKFGWEFANRICRRTPRPLKDKDIKARGAGKEPLSDEKILALLQKMVKQRQESITMYEQGGRAELAQAEKDEVTVISSYLPQQMDEAETKAAIQAAIAETGAASMKDMGKVVAALRGKYVGRMDFAKASGLVKDMVRKG